MSPNIRRDVYARMERTKQMDQDTHSLFDHIPASNHLKSRKDFQKSVKPSYFPKRIRTIQRQRRLRDKLRLENAYDSPWLTWSCLNPLRTGCA